MKRLQAVRLFKREDSEESKDRREPTILDHGDPITMQLTRELEERRRRLAMNAPHSAGL
ncbi:MAG: hypothetical protein AAGL11_03375 [Pseudomonadota bacterium]